jgi:hypothetical protein
MRLKLAMMFLLTGNEFTLGFVSVTTTGTLFIQLLRHRRREHARERVWLIVTLHIADCRLQIE